MFKNKIINYIIFALVFIAPFYVKADTVLPDNVKITSSSDGSSTTVVINSKPGFVTNVETSCVNGKCTNNATSKAITAADLQKMQDSFKKQQDIINAFWKQQDEIFAQQQKMFQELWGVNSF